MFLYFEFKISPRSHIKWSYFQFYFNSKRKQTCFTCFKINVNLRFPLAALQFFYTIFKQKRNLHTGTNLTCKNVFTEDHLFDICMSYAKHLMLIAQCKLCSHSFDTTIHKTNHRILLADILWNHSLLKSDVFFSMDIGINIV